MKPKLSFHHQHELNQLPDRIAVLESEIKALLNVLDDANLYAKEPERFDKTLRELTTKQAALETSINRWAELEALANATG
jgi:ATP-binding cassette subfamily F protein uup